MLDESASAMNGASIDSACTTGCYDSMPGTLP